MTAADTTTPEPTSHDEGEQHESASLATEVSQLLPAWMSSLVTHLMLFLVLALLSSAGNGFGGFGTVIECEAGGTEGSGGDDTGPGDAMAALDQLPPLDAELADPTTLNPLADIASLVMEDLPKIELNGFSSAALDARNLDTLAGNGSGKGNGIGDFVGDGEGAGGGGIGLNPIRTQIFGVADEGTRFVYVFDRSESMTAGIAYTSEGKTVYSKTPLEAAKSELLRSIDDLQPKQQFQIIFYNHDYVMFDNTSASRKLINGTNDNKQRATEFVRQVIGAGATRHLEPLEVALRMRPDVIFLLTDGESKDDPSSSQIGQIRKLNKSYTKINVIQFCYGDRDGGTLVELAKENGGTHIYYNIANLGPGLPDGPASMRNVRRVPPGRMPGQTPGRMPGQMGGQLFPPAAR